MSKDKPATTSVVYPYFDCHEADKQPLKHAIGSLVIQLYDTHKDSRTEVDILFSWDSTPQPVALALQSPPAAPKPLDNTSGGSLGVRKASQR